VVELLYGTKNFARIADEEIREGRAIAVRVHGWRRPFIYRLLSLYAEHDRISQQGPAPRNLSLGLAWRILLAPTLFGLIHQARSSGMSLLVRDTGKSLEVRLEPSNPTFDRDAPQAARPSP
jgi:hypothetical protein